ncbi:hypothetical protein [Pelagerythrobacter marinus]|jgi:hypothetical protein|uniref:C-type lysozyme inhibitor domain-containing protein n=1 Tax=Pelagerythrobacter marinus TaxID=538382 RepID=A0ABW9UUD4_9SPHN|nr:hypothetical protein [Pelagerythrobacter marinus]MEC9067865.1 hypothetical protein [Pseudomonadota bacterium]MXO68471.1 hypothetical protein [Pelagerythrobacter marinus]USA40270.1 hypothetical protein NCF86_03695 [Pelagerythrobacter marinus]WPZ05607.1 hypothetical protein T8T98_09205 [Pelagerythrobacter marinus]
MHRIAAIIALGLGLSACATGGPGKHGYFDCSDGSVLKVNFTHGGATVVRNNGVPIYVRSVQSVGASVFENRAGYRLQVSGDTVTWSGKTREAPLTCRRVTLPR